jgi:hypothetical protein
MRDKDFENMNVTPANSDCSPASYLNLEFSGTTCEHSEWSSAWLAFTDGEYYHRCRQIMLDYGMGCGDVEMLTANFWEAGWLAAKCHGGE